MRTLMTATLAAALTLVSGLAMAQSYGPGDPAFADTTDPGSIPSPRWHHGYAPYGGGYAYRGYYAPGYDYGYGYGYTRPYRGTWRWSSGNQW